MILEDYIDKGILMERLLSASSRVSITFANGLVKVQTTNGEAVFGIENCPVTMDALERAIEVANG